MPIARKFFDWNAPALPQVVDWLCHEHTSLGHVDLSHLLVVFPGRRAGRRFLDLLTERTAGKNHPPEVITLGDLPEHLYRPQKPFAPDLTQRLAWAEALRSQPASSLQKLLRNVPDPGDIARWLDLGTLLARHHAELAADGLHFGDVVSQGSGLSGFGEHDRWRILREVQLHYLGLLDRLDLWDQQTARLKAIELGECRTERQILLVAAVDIHQAPRRMLDQVADSVTALIHAPESLADRFDEHGCLLSEPWNEATIDLRPDQVRVVDGPADQAAEVAYAIAELDGRFRADEITLGVADEGLVPHLRRQLRACGVATRPVVEQLVLQTPPATLLQAIAEYLADGRFGRFAALARHPDLDSWLAAQGLPTGWLAELDRYFTTHLQPRLGDWLGSRRETERLRPVTTAIRALLAPLVGPPRPLPQWTEPILDVLLTIYGHVEFRPDDPAARVALSTCKQIRAALAEHLLVPETLGPLFTAAEAIELALQAISGGSIPPPADPQAIPIVGWLELPLDDAPVAIVTSFNEGFVPSSLNADLFLPNSLRRQLGINDNARRHARDAYALSALLASRAAVTLIVGRRDAAGDPLKPSRLLFAAEPEAIARRVLQFFQPEGAGEGQPPDTRPPLPQELTTSRTTPAYRVPRPQPLLDREALARVSVTGFKSYLSCPYRYYLSYVVGLGELDDAAEEMSALDFGNLLHEVLRAFGTSPLRGSTDASEIRDYVDRELEQAARRRFGSLKLPAVSLQVAQAGQRLRAFAERQAGYAAEGWEIRFIEHPNQPEGVPLDLGDGRTLQLIGRIDRIDFHPREKRWRILDYKTSANGDPPEKVHRRGGEWVDLQLPLYQYLAETLGVSGRVELGYFLLPEDSGQTRIEIAPWSPEEVAAAQDLARSLGQQILDEVFWPPRDASELEFAADWAPICQSGLFDGEPLPAGPVADRHVQLASDEGEPE